MIKSTTVQSLSEAKEILDSLSKEEKEENPKIKETLTYLKSFVKAKSEKTKKLKKALEELNMLKLNAKHISKIIDISPEDADDVRKIFIGEDISLEQDEINKVLETIKANK